MDIHEVLISKEAEKQLRKMPAHIVLKLQGWIDAVKINGLREVRKCSGFHDEPLRGERDGQRSIRLNRAYRAIYTLRSDDAVEIAIILEVNKHAY